MKYLFISGHTDDIELSCGATIAKLSPDNECHYVAFSAPHDPIMLEIELKNSLKVLKIPRNRVKTWNLPVRRFNEQRQDILDTLVKLKAEIDPDYVFTHSLADNHQDHRVIAQESLRAFKNCCLLAYNFPWNSTRSEENYFVKVSRETIETKIKALKCYKSQWERPYMTEESIFALARTAGLRCGCDYAEGFEVVRLIS